ncbi:uncharacterized protein [Rutidosis leptorrhynchoides]|uniref:uncharacterized protein n=1 Tax=Rutidosis leptorrhynchoides TaxID=125765 RepID=UPI003A9A3013
MKNTKEALRSWSIHRYGTIDVELEQWKKIASDLETKADAGPIDDNERAEWLNARAKWAQKEKEKTAMHKQKARLKWAAEGDDNTAFFHSTIRRRNNSANIRGLYINGLWVENLSEIKDEVLGYFKKIFEVNSYTKPDFNSLGNLPFQSPSTADVDLLEAPFLEAEIWSAIKNCDPAKAPGPDGFNLSFYKKILLVDQRRFKECNRLVLG